MNFRKLVKLIVPARLFKKIAPAGHLAEAVLAQLIYGFPARKLKVIGVTGTDGKSTTCMLIGQMLRENGLKTATLTTIAVDLADGEGWQPSPKHMTTAGVWQLLKMIKLAQTNGAQWLVLETSSHALSQYRVWGIPFSVVTLTNISHEHLDYHGTMENYRRAKLKLFKQANRNRKGFRAGVINGDDDGSTEIFCKAIKHPITYGIKNGDLRAYDIKSSKSGSTYYVVIAGKKLPIVCNLPGRFNIYNSLAAVGVGRAIGLQPVQIRKGIAATKQVPGRMERVDTRSSFSVYVDYAVTPNALASVLQAAREIAGKAKVLLVFGATGDRDKSKRPEMGRVASRGADKIFLTDDETYTEDPPTIRKAVYAGIIKAGAAAKTKEVGDRGEAIAKALQEAKHGDVVLITGLGHQKTRNMGGQDISWSDTATVKDLLNAG